MSGGEVRKVSRQDIQLVQNLIERCLQLYMSQKEVVNTLLDQAKIEPGFTELVWLKLEEENQEFFRAYHLRLILKDQIVRFNELLEEQVSRMHRVCQTGVASLSVHNGSQIPPMHQNAPYHVPEHNGIHFKPETMHQDISANLPNAYPMQPRVDLSAHSGRIDVSPNTLLDQSSNMGVMQGMNAGMIKSEASYPGNATYMFGAGGNVVETRPAIGDAAVSSFSSVESSSQPLNETVLDPDPPSYGFLGQISRNFSLSDLTADFSSGSDILETYARSPFLPPEANNFLDPQGQHQGDVQRLDTISEGLSYEDFGSE